jgi:uncharacterized Zn-binding protein involved in type VI secretion
MSKGICRVGDTVTGTCKVSAGGHPRAFTGTWKTGSGVVKCDGLAVVRENDTGQTDCNHTFKAVGGVGTLTADGLKIQRVGDAVIVVGGGDGVSTTGSGVGTTE